MAADPHLARIRKASPEMRTCPLMLLSLVLATLAGCNEGDSGQTEPPPGGVTHQVSLTVTGPGTVEDSANGIDCSATCNYTIAQGRELTLTQRPESDAHFTAWSGDCSTGEQCSITVTGPLDIGATFVADDPPRREPIRSPDGHRSRNGGGYRQRHQLRFDLHTTTSQKTSN